MLKIVFLADLFEVDLPTGGGEKSNTEFLHQVIKLGHCVTTEYTYIISLKQMEIFNKSGYKFIVANFICLPENIKKYLTDKCEYVILEHDHKYLRSRNPGIYKDFIAPKEEIINFKFYENAKAVICQSKLHKEVLEKNLDILNIKSIGGNFWSDDEIQYIKDIQKDDKKEIASIPDFGGTLSKGTDKAIQYCIENNLKYKLIPKMPTREFLSEISDNKYLVFIPRTLETFSRIVIEAKMLDINVRTIKKLIGACSEPWFNDLSSVFLANYMLDMKPEFCKRILDSFNA